MPSLLLMGNRDKIEEFQSSRAPHHVLITRAIRTLREQVNNSFDVVLLV
jgi:hypothetical protein